MGNKKLHATDVWWCCAARPRDSGSMRHPKFNEGRAGWFHHNGANIWGLALLIEVVILVMMNVPV